MEEMCKGPLDSLSLPTSLPQLHHLLVPSSGVEEPKESNYSSSSDECAGDIAARPPGKKIV